jgi:thioredoxin 1
MPTFLILHNSAVINTLRGADPRALTVAVEAAVKLAGSGPGAGFDRQGRVLGGEGRASTAAGLARGQGLFDGIVAFLGLYVTSLFSLDPYRAAEASPFNVHRVPGPAAQRAGLTPPTKRVGTLADVSG